MEKRAINPQREEYLVTIFKLMQDNDKITNKMISEMLNFAPSSVSEMLKKLKNEGYIIDDKDNILTDKGIRTAKEIISRHRLREYFLQEKLHYNRKDIHQLANGLQSVTTDDLRDRLNEFLGYPDYCPHGSAIYINNEESNKDFVSISDAKVGHRYIIRRFEDDKLLLDYSESMGINIGDKIYILDFDKFDQTAIIEFDSDIKRISPKACQSIYLKEIK